MNPTQTGYSVPTKTKNVSFSPDAIIIQSQQFEESTEAEEGETHEAEEDYKGRQNTSQVSQVPSIPTAATTMKLDATSKKRKLDFVNGEPVIDLRSVKNIIRDKLLLDGRYWIQIQNTQLRGGRYDQVVIGRDPTPGDLAKDGTPQKPFTMGIPLKSLDALLRACAHLTGRDEDKVLSCY